MAGNTRTPTLTNAQPVSRQHTLNSILKPTLITGLQVATCTLNATPTPTLTNSDTANRKHTHNSTQTVSHLVITLWMLIVTPSRLKTTPIETTDSAPTETIDAAVVLAMYSTTDDTEGDIRAASVREITNFVERGDMDADTALSLLNDVAPEASIYAREEAAKRLADISGESGGELNPEQSMEVANELTRLITGHGIDAEQRSAAAREMARLSRAGELNPDNASELMDTIAPEWSVTERKEALGYLAWQFSEGE